MRMNYLKLISVFLFTSLIISSCQKSVTEASENNGLSGNSSGKLPDASLKNQCQLTHMALEGFDNRFHYNSKGLADEWRIDYGDGVPDIYLMEYDNENRLSRAWYYYAGELSSTIDFVWENNLLTEEHWDYGGFLFEGVNTYDKKGQMIKREFTHGWSASAEYSANGNTLKRDIFLEGQLLRSAEYTYSQPNRNPFLAIRGIPYGFPFVLFDFSKWWEASEKITFYYDGIPSVDQDIDPSRTVFDIGFQNYPVAVDHFDRVSNGPILFNFEYQNCGPEEKASEKINGLSPLSSVRGKKRFIGNMPLKTGPGVQIKKQLEQMRYNKNAEY